MRAVVLIETLEHFLDPKESLLHIQRLVAPPALLFGTTPNVDREEWRGTRDILEPKDHVFLFGEGTLRVLFNKVRLVDFTIRMFGGERGDAFSLFRRLGGMARTVAK